MLEKAAEARSKADGENGLRICMFTFTAEVKRRNVKKRISEFSKGVETSTSSIQILSTLEPEVGRQPYPYISYEQNMFWTRGTCFACREHAMKMSYMQYLHVCGDVNMTMPLLYTCAGSLLLAAMVKIKIIVGIVNVL